MPVVFLLTVPRQYRCCTAVLLCVSNFLFVLSLFLPSYIRHLSYCFYITFNRICVAISRVDGALKPWSAIHLGVGNSPPPPPPPKKKNKKKKKNIIINIITGIIIIIISDKIWLSISCESSVSDK